MNWDGGNMGPEQREGCTRQCDVTGGRERTAGSVLTGCGLCDGHVISLSLSFLPCEVGELVVPIIRGFCMVQLR